MRLLIVAAMLVLLVGCCQVHVIQRELPEGGTETTVDGSWRKLTIYTSEPAHVYFEAE